MIREQLRENIIPVLTIAGGSLGLAAGLIGSHEIVEANERANAEAAAYTAEYQDELQQEIDVRFDEVADELSTLEGWLGRGCLFLIRNGTSELKTVDELKLATECDMPFDVRIAAATLRANLSEQHRLLYKYTSGDRLSDLADSASDTIQDSENTSLSEVVSGDYSEKVIGVRFDDNDRLVEVRQRNFTHGYSFGVLSAVIGLALAYFGGKKAQRRHQRISRKNEIIQNLKASEEERIRAEEERINNEVREASEFALGLADERPDVFWQRMSREDRDT